MHYTGILSVGLLLTLAACSTSVQSNPTRTATEQMLISTAADHAAAELDLPIPAHTPVFVDNTNMDGTDIKYAIGAIRARLLRQGARLVDDKKSADIVVETRSGALSTDQNTFLIGIPQFTVPIPFASTPLTLPEIALYGSKDQNGIAKFAFTGYNAKNGELLAAQDPQYGFSHNTQKTVLIFVSWTSTDAVPDEDDVTKKQADRNQEKLTHPKLGLAAPQ